MEGDLSRASESPTRTIDSANSTQASVETIVDRSPSLTILEHQSATMADSMNTTNHYNKNSLTNSQISMISNDQKESHIYTSPDLMAIGKTVTEKPLLPIKESSRVGLKSDKNTEKKPKNGSVEQKSKKLTKTDRGKFPAHILLGVTQLVLSIALVALGGLLLARGASLASTGSGIWSGATAAISGALGVINVKAARTGFLACSLICIASSTLAMALTGIGLVRDINQLEQKEISFLNMKSAISASSGLIFALLLHFFVSILSVYQSAVRLCSRKLSNTQMLENVLTAHNASILSQQKIDEYFQSIGLDTSSMARGCNKDKMITTVENSEKMMAMYLGNGKRAPQAKPSRPIMLVPAGNGGNMLPTMLPPPPPPPGYHRHAIMYAPQVLPPGSLPYPTIPLPPLPPGSTIHPHDLKALYRIHGQKVVAASEISRHNKRIRTGKRDHARRQRRKSESDAENKRAFTYTGLDRAIADSFLERQEISNGSNVDYTSSSDSSRICAGDVVM